jgi:uncharacterized protein YecE (DUF72 family)
MDNWRLGTMGFSYAEWAGVFYPRELKPGDYLAYYAKHFDAVELDTTFYAVPPADRVRRWADVTPDDFRFSVKTPRAITHDQSLEKGLQPMLQFIDVMRALGKKLAVVLLQFPPSFTIREMGKLDRFLSDMPADLQLAAEFRHLSWDVEPTADLLRKHGVAWVSVDHVGHKSQIRATTDFLYLRWLGERGRFPDKNHEQVDMSDRLRWWKSQIDESVAGRSIQTVWGFFNDDYAGHAVATCNRFKAIVGLPVNRPELIAGQGVLFGE